MLFFFLPRAIVFPYLLLTEFALHVSAVISLFSLFLLELLSVLFIYLILFYFFSCFLFLPSMCKGKVRLMKLLREFSYSLKYSYRKHDPVNRVVVHVVFLSVGMVLLISRLYGICVF